MGATSQKLNRVDRSGAGVGVGHRDPLSVGLAAHRVVRVPETHNSKRRAHPVRGGQSKWSLDGCNGSLCSLPGRRMHHGE